MAKNVLVIGGSLFAGRVFCIQASKSGRFNLHVVNRGNFPMEFERVTQYKCGRNSPRMIAWLTPDIEYDALVDFCAYNPGEIAPMIEALRGRIKQYIFLSTARVYAPGAEPPDEASPILTPEDAKVRRHAVYDNPSGKIELERELADACAKAGIEYTILRPAFIYGPLNYVARESFFIEKIAKKHVVPVPADSTSRFNFVYVLDVAAAIIACIGERKAFGETFNLSGPEAVTYKALISDFERFNSGPFETKEITVAEALDKKMPFLLPLVEDILVDGEKITKTLNFKYTPFSEGMENTFRTFYSLFTS